MNKKYEYDCNYKAETLVGPNYKLPVMGPEFELAQAYVPYQVFCKVYEPERGLRKGTIFPELYKPMKEYKEHKK
jgi:hypothetical protein